MKFSINTLGCKVNNYESELIKEQLETGHFIYVQEDDNPDICIVNTCSVTNQADSKSMKTIRMVKKINPQAMIIVCGCALENKKVDLTNIPADIIIGNHDKGKIIDYINEFRQNNKQIIKFYNLINSEFEDMEVKDYSSKTRAFIKIQDGCNNYCSYCIIPYLRGTVRSKDFNEAINEIKNITINHQEIVLTGIHTGSYQSNDYDLTDLIHEISKIDALKRIRISSIEITELNDKFLDELRNNQKICDHLHIPLQSGSNKILKLMNRKYDLEYYLNKVETIRNIRPNISITTDLIVGFPDESETDFIDTINFINQIKFTKIHVFPYSIRKGTKASTMPNQINGDIKKNRVKQILDLSNELELKYYQKFIGQTLDVVFEQSKNFSHGHTDNYINVMVKQKLVARKMYKIKLTEIIDHQVYGELK